MTLHVFLLLIAGTENLTELVTAVKQRIGINDEEKIQLLVGFLIVMSKSIIMSMVWFQSSTNLVFEPKKFAPLGSPPFLETIDPF